MSISHDLTDPYTICANKLAGAFQNEACTRGSLENQGYQGFPDPVFNSTGEEVTTDFISFGIDDIQHFKIIGAKPKIDADSPFVESEDKIRSELEEAAKLTALDSAAVSDYLDKRGQNVEPSIQEPVIIIPEPAYDKYQDIIHQYCEEEELIAWTITTGDINRVQKVAGTHSTSKLEDELCTSGSNSGIELYDINSDICPIVRNSDMRLIKFRFITRLVTYAYGEQTTEIPYADIDQIMMDRYPPLLGHLSREERDENWQQCMLSLRNTLKLVKDSKEKMDTFEWKKERFLYDRSARSNLIEDVRSNLGIGEEA